MVKHLAPSDHEATCCPICLDSLTCARITKCGHFYCLSCLLRHVQVHAQSNPYAHVKCPCCSLPLHVSDLRPVLLTTSLPPQLHQRIKLTKLHRTKGCPSPYLPLPDAPKRSSSHAAPTMTDPDAPFSRFNYIDFPTYQEHLATNKVELEMELASLTKHQPQQQQQHTHKFSRQQHQFSQPKYQSDVEAIFVTSSMDVVKKEIKKAMEEYDEEQVLAESFSEVGSGVCQQQPPHLLANKYEFAKLPPQKPRDAETNDGRPRRESVGSESDSVSRRYRGDSIGSYASMDTEGIQGTDLPPNSPTSLASEQAKPRGKRSKGHKEFPKASMYLDSEGSTHFYQCEDGQLCFLARFNMSCLLADFSPKVPDVESLAKPRDSLNYWQRRKLLPLPDSLEGEILEIESVHLTPDLRKRMPFLGHLPLYTDIHFVELDLNSLLSIECKKKFKAEFDKRRKRRQGKVKAEKREDKLAQKKEEERIKELKARMQQIDPNDDFFQVSLPEEPVDLTGDAFGPAISGSSSAGAGSPAVTAATAGSRPAFSFSNVCQSGGAFPVLAANQDLNFPSLGSSPPSGGGNSQPGPSWGSPSRSNQPQGGWGQPKKAPSWGSPSHPNPSSNVTPLAAENGPVGGSKSLPMPGPKKKSKGKKISLFSTGGQRGTSY